MNAWITADGDPISAEVINADLKALFDSLTASTVQPTTILIPRRNHIRMRRSRQMRNAMRRFPFKRVAVRPVLVRGRLA